jgi:hypothetical protein
LFKQSGGQPAWDLTTRDRLLIFRSSGVAAVGFARSDGLRGSNPARLALHITVRQGCGSDLEQIAGYLSLVFGGI